MAYYTNKSGQLVAVGSEDMSQEDFGKVNSIMESADDEAIVRSMTTGEGSDSYVYKFLINTASGQKEIVGISVEGAHEIANQRKNFETLPNMQIDKDTDPDYAYVILRIKNHATNNIFLGVGRQSKFVVGKGNAPDRTRMDEHWFVKAVSKAERNGILHHVPGDVVAGIVQEFITAGKTKKLAPPGVQTTSKQTAQPAQKPAAVPAVVKQTTTGSGQTDEAARIAAAIAAQENRLKQLHSQIATMFKTELGMTDEQRKAELQKKFGVDSLLNMSEVQLKECVAYVGQLIEQRVQKVETATTQPQSAEITTEPPKIETATPPTVDDKTKKALELGFENFQEQTNARSKIFGLLTEPANLGMSIPEAQAFIAQHGWKGTADIPKDKLPELETELKGIIDAKNNPAPGEPEV